MAIAENNILNKIRLALSGLAVTFRVNTGQAWTGNKVVRHKDGSVTIYDARPFRTGTPKGYSDLTGWVPVTVTPDMVGKQVAIFLATEVKTAKGRVTDDQQLFIDKVNLDGGIGFVARSDDEAIKKLAAAMTSGLYH